MSNPMHGQSRIRAAGRDRLHGPGYGLLTAGLAVVVGALVATIWW